MLHHLTVVGRERGCGCSVSADVNESIVKKIHEWNCIVPAALYASFVRFPSVRMYRRMYECRLRTADAAFGQLHMHFGHFCREQSAKISRSIPSFCLPNIGPVVGIDYLPRAVFRVHFRSSTCTTVHRRGFVRPEAPCGRRRKPSRPDKTALGLITCRAATIRRPELSVARVAKNGCLLQA